MDRVTEEERRSGRRAWRAALLIAGMVSLGLATPGVAAPNIPARFAGASADGSRVWFQTSEAIPNTGDVDAADGDSDTSIDVYESTATGVRLLST
jgi:hypothetical protein